MKGWPFPPPWFGLWGLTFSIFGPFLFALPTSTTWSHFTFFCLFCTSVTVLQKVSPETRFERCESSLSANSSTIPFSNSGSRLQWEKLRRNSTEFLFTINSWFPDFLTICSVILEQNVPHFRLFDGNQKRCFIVENFSVIYFLKTFKEWCQLPYTIDTNSEITQWENSTGSTALSHILNESGKSFVLKSHV